MSAGRRWSWHQLEPQWAERLVADAAVRRGELIVDIGAGTGALTLPLARAGARVIAVELHEGRATRLRQRVERQAGEPDGHLDRRDNDRRYNFDRRGNDRHGNFDRRDNDRRDNDRHGEVDGRDSIERQGDVDDHRAVDGHGHLDRDGNLGGRATPVVANGGWGGGGLDVVVVHGDLRTVPLPRRPFRVVANPPFAHTAALLRRITDRGAAARGALLVLQRGAADKLVARPPRGWSAQVVRQLPRSAFSPRPIVDASVVALHRHRR